MNEKTKNIQDIIQYAYLNLGDINKLDLKGPFSDGPIFDPEDETNPPIKLLETLLNPEYIGFVCKHFLGLDTAPFQNAILYNMWTHPFPMLIATRGGGKSWILSVYAILRALLVPGTKVVIIGAAFRQSKFLFDYMIKIWNDSDILRDICGNDPRQGPHTEPDKCTMIIGSSSITCIPLGDGCVLGDTFTILEDGISYISNEHKTIEKEIVDREVKIYGNGNFNLSDESYCNGIKDVKVITTKRGYSYGGTYNHKMKVLENNEVVWKRTDEMKIGDRILIDIEEKWFPNTNDVTNEQAYALGLMIGDGCYTNKYKLGFATKDKDFIPHLCLGTNLKWKQTRDNIHWTVHGLKNVSNWLNFWGMTATYTKDKQLPQKMLSASKFAMSACLAGLFDTDGTLQIGRKDGGVGITVSFSNTSKELVRQIQFILTMFGIASTVTSRQRKNKNWNRAYELFITGTDAIKFSRDIGFRLKRKQKILIDAISEKKRFPKRTGQIGDIFTDEIISIEDSVGVTYDLHVPETHEYCANGFYSHNSKIRGLRAHVTISDEFASIPRAIYENVVIGFGVVNANPVETMRRVAANKALRDLGIFKDGDEQVQESNQTIISGTAYYAFNHFYDYWMQYKKIILSRGDPEKLKEVFPEGVSDSFDWKSFSVIRIPYELIPAGFMDDKAVDRAKATINNSSYLLEYGAIFTADSNGFFKRSMIEACVCNEDKPIVLNSGTVYFTTMLQGSKNKKYVFGVDPAFASDNFSIVVVEMNSDHRRLVYVWTTNKTAYNNQKKKGLVTEDDYYNFCCRKIRDLMKVFKCEGIALDTQGGGYAVAERLQSLKGLEDGEQPILPVIEEDNEQETDHQPGLHILHNIKFISAEWTNKANFGLQKDFQDKTLLFPAFDTITIGLSIEEDKKANRQQNTLEDAVLEIEELKDELASIMHTETTGGRDRWDTPEVKLPGGKKGRLRKDRYSSLLMANYVARELANVQPVAEYKAVGGFINTIDTKNIHGPSMTGPQWYKSVF